MPELGDVTDDIPSSLPGITAALRATTTCSTLAALANMGVGCWDWKEVEEEEEEEGVEDKQRNSCLPESRGVTDEERSRPQETRAGTLRAFESISPTTTASRVSTVSVCSSLAALGVGC